MNASTKGLLKFAPNLGWRNVEIMRQFKERYTFPIILENEAKAAAIGEREFIYPQADNMVFVSINEGIGCGIIFNGELYRGSSGNAGEYGHIIIDRKGSSCHCGSYGCWETLASENYIIKAYKEMFGTGFDFDATFLKNEIYRRGEEGDKEVLKIFQETGKSIGVGLINIVNSLSPELLVIGGGIVRIKDYIFDDIVETLEKGSLSFAYRKTDVKISKLGDLAIIYGLAKLVFDRSTDFNTKGGL